MTKASGLRAAKRFHPKIEPIVKIRPKINQIHISEIPLIYNSADKILDAVCMALSVDVEVVLSQSRKKYVSQARFIAIGLSLRLNCKITLKGLGRLLRRDHSTIIYGRQLFNDLYTYDKEFKEKTDKVIHQLVSA